MNKLANSITARRGISKSATDAKSSFTHCLELVRKLDYENYLCALRLKGKERAAVLALRAFNAEIASVPDRLQQPALVMMRLVWWKDAVDLLYKGKILDHPVLNALSLVLRDCKLTKRWLDRLVEARMEDLEKNSPPFSLQDLEAYAEKTSSSLLYLCLEASGVHNVSTDHVASHIGKAQGISLLLRGTVHHWASRRSYLPLEVTAKHGVVEEDLFSGRGSAALPEAVLEVASSAMSHLVKARSLRSTVAPAVMPLMLPAVPVGLYLKELERQNFDLLSPQLARGICGVSHLWLHSQLALNSMNKTF